MKQAIRINHKRLGIELSFIGFVIIASFIIFAVPKIAEVNQSDDPYYQYKTLYQEVLDYDYTKGRDDRLETKIDSAVTPPSDTSFQANFNQLQYYFNLKAKAEYYYHFKQYRTVIETLKLAQNLVPDDTETAYIYQSFIDVYRAVGDTENLNKYLNGDFEDEDIEDDSTEENSAEAHNSEES